MRTMKDSDGNKEENQKRNPNSYKNESQIHSKQQETPDP